MGSVLRTILLSAASLAAQAGAANALAQRIDACGLLTPKQIGEVIGTAVSAGVRSDAGTEPSGAYSSSCVWLLDTTQAPRDLQLSGRSYVILNAMRWPAGSRKAISFLDAFRDAHASGVLAVAPVAKMIGDEALWWGDGLAVVRRDVSFGLSVHQVNAPTSPPGAREQQLAARVLRVLDANAGSR